MDELLLLSVVQIVSWTYINIMHIGDVDDDDDAPTLCATSNNTQHTQNENAYTYFMYS